MLLAARSIPEKSYALHLAHAKTSPRPGGLLGVARVKAATVPAAAPAPTIALTRITIVRTRRCLAGAIATPAGWDAATPLTLKASAAPTSRHSRSNPCRTTPNSIPGTEISLVIGECEQWPPKPVLHRLLSFAQLRFHSLGGGKFPISVGLGAQSTRVQFASLLLGCTTSRTRYG